MAEEEEQVMEGGEELLDEGEVEEDDIGAVGEEEEGEEEGVEPKKKDEKKDKLMKEYMELITQIAAQNKCVHELKAKICEKCQKKCMTKCEEREIQNLRCCLERENLKLQCLIRRAMTLQEEDPTERWDEIEIATTFGEDSMPVGFTYNLMQSVCKKTLDDDEDGPCPPCPPYPPCPGEDPKADLEKFLRCLLQEAGKKRKKPPRPCPDDGGTMLEFDDNIIQRILCALQGQKTGGGTKKPPCKMSNVCKELNRSYNMQEKLVQDNANLEGDRFKLQEELLTRDNVIDCLQRKIQTMQCDLQKLCKEKEKLVKEVACCGGNVNPKTIERIKKYKQCTKALRKNIEKMQCSVERMKIEMDSLKRERNSWQNRVQDYESPCPKRKTKSNEIEELKKNYANLLVDYCKKDNELKEMEQRVKGFVDPCEKRGGGEVDQTELIMLREKVSDLQEEQEEFKCLIKEQSSQMEDYRNKFLIAQQKVEEQKCIIEKLEMNNKRIEDQINMEIQRIKSKFQEKLKDLAQLPKLLENEQIKLATACKEKEDLEQKLRLVCKELKALKVQQNKETDDPKLAARLKQAEHDLAVFQKKYDELKADKDVLCEKLEKTMDDLDTLRTESARIIARTKERAESQRETLQCRIDKLEKDLAQCRATASISISDREEIIKEMKGQMCQLSYSFDSAQKQIKTLKNHIVFLSNENCYPVKC